MARLPRWDRVDSRLGESTGFIPITHREEKDRAATMLQSAARGGFARVALRVATERRAKARLRAHALARGKPDASLHGGSGPECKMQAGSEALHRLTQEHSRSRTTYGKRAAISGIEEESAEPRAPMQVARACSDLTRPRDPLHEGFLFGSAEAHRRSVEVAAAPRSFGKNKRNDLKPTTNAGFCFGSEELQRRACEQNIIPSGHRIRRGRREDSGDETLIPGLGGARRRVGQAGPKPASDLHGGDSPDQRPAFVPEDRVLAVMQREPKARGFSDLHARSDAPGLGSAKLAGIVSRHMSSGGSNYARRTLERNDASCALASHHVRMH